MSDPSATPPMVKLDDVVTYLEMTARPTRPSIPVPAGKIALMRAERCTVSFYRYLYSAVGEPWLWFERRLWSDERLAAIIQKPEVEISVLYAGGVPAGYYELDRSQKGEVELSYFGLVSDFIGRGYGTYLLQAAVRRRLAVEPAACLGPYLHLRPSARPRRLSARRLRRLSTRAGELRRPKAAWRPAPGLSSSAAAAAVLNAATATRASPTNAAGRPKSAREAGSGISTAPPGASARVTLP